MEGKADRLEGRQENGGGSQTPTLTRSAPTALVPALQEVQTLVEQRDWLLRELAECERDLRLAWRNVPHMPVRSALEMELEGKLMETRESRLKKMAHGDKNVAGILRGLIYG